MARRRMIDPNFWQSQDVAKLNIRQRLLAIGLFSNADDEGRGVANPAYVRATVFPFDNFSASVIKKDLEILCQALNLRIFDVGGNKYYVWTRWHKWQRVEKPQTSIIPAPPWENSGNDSGNESGNESRNDSGNESGSDSGLKERKLKEVKGKEEEEDRDLRSYTDLRSIDLKKDQFQQQPETGNSSCSSWIFQLFEKEFGKKPLDAEKKHVQAWLREFVPELVQEAFRRAVIQGKPNLFYIGQILHAWRDTGLHSLPAVMEKDPLGKKQAAPANGEKPREDKRREEKIAMACTNILFQLGETPELAAAAEIARGYGEELVPDILARLKLPPPGGKGGVPP